VACRVAGLLDWNFSLFSLNPHSEKEALSDDEVCLSVCRQYRRGLAYIRHRAPLSAMMRPSLASSGVLSSQPTGRYTCFVQSSRMIPCYSASRHKMKVLDQLTREMSQPNELMKNNVSRWLGLLHISARRMGGHKSAPWGQHAPPPGGGYIVCERRHTLSNMLK